MTGTSFKRAMTKMWRVTLNDSDERQLAEVMNRICEFHRSVNVPSDYLQCYMEEMQPLPTIRVELTVQGLSETGQMLMPLRLRKLLTELSADYQFSVHAVDTKRIAA